MQVQNRFDFLTLWSMLLFQKKKMPFQYILSDGSYGHTPIKYLFHFSTATKKVVLLIDSLSVLQSLALGNPEDYTLQNLIQSLNSLTSRTTAVLQWIPAHTSIRGNEVANQLAKEGSKKQQPKSKLSYQEAKGHCRLRSHMKKIGIEKSAL